MTDNKKSHSDKRASSPQAPSQPNLRLWDKGSNVNSDMLKFTVGDDPDWDMLLLPYDILASAAQAEMLVKIGIMSSAELDSVIAALKECWLLAEQGSFAIPIELEDCHTALETFLVSKVGEAGKRIHTGRSRNDQVLVAMRLYLRDSLISLADDVCTLSAQLVNRAKSETHQIMPGYTHMQLAMPSSIGMWLHAFGDSYLEVAKWGIKVMESLNANPLGAASGFGVPLPLDRIYTQKLLGFDRTQLNPIEVQNSRGRYELRVLNWILEVARITEKLAWDLVLYTTHEFGFVALPKELTTGSSIMPQKRNPDLLELLRAKSARLRGNLSELDWVVGKLPSNYHRDLQLSKKPVMSAVEELKSMLLVLKIAVSEMSFNRNRLEAACTDEVYATYDAYRLVNDGMPFRDAYRQAAQNCENSKLDIQTLRKDFDKIATRIDVWITQSEEELGRLNSSLSGLRKTKSDILKTLLGF